MIMRKRLFAVFLACCLILSLSACSFPVYTDYPEIDESSSFSIYFIDVGQGDSALVECDGHYMLIDGGSRSADEKVSQVLTEKGVDTLDLLAFSHIHEDHIGGLVDGLSSVAIIDTVWGNTTKGSTAVFENFKEELSARNNEIYVPSVDETYMLGSAEVSVVDVASKEGNDCLILLITYGETEFLFTGDMEHNMESDICDRYGDDRIWSIDLLKVAHHGSDTSTSIRFLRMLMPEYAVISVGEDNRYGHPTEQTLSRLEQADVTYYRTDECGDITVTSDGRQLFFAMEK